MTDEFEESFGFREIQASEILAKIVEGKPANYENTIIKGILDISNISNKLQKDEGKALIMSNIKIANCQFEGSVDFFASKFIENIDFTGSRFNEGVLFREAWFCKNASFVESEFHRSADFNGSRFQKSAIFWRSIFLDFADFEGVQFEEDAIFDGSRFNSYVDFSRSRFCGNARFPESEFWGYARLNSSYFNKLLYLDNARIHIMFFDDNTFKKDSISIKDSDFSKLKVHWKPLDSKLKYDEAAYLALVHNYNGLGWFSDADDCYYYYRTIRRKEHLGGLLLALDWVSLFFYGYGVRFYYPLAWLIGICVISAIVYIWGGQAQFPGAFGLSTVILTTTTQINGLNGPLTGFVGLRAL